MLGRVVESLTFKIGEKLPEYVQGTYMATRDYKFTIETLGRNLKSLSAKASDVKEEIKKAELSGKKKRKREVENWLTQVQKLETEFVEWGGDVESEGFISRFLGGDRAKQLKERVDELIEQSKHFGGLLLDVHEARGEVLLTRGLVGNKFWKTLDEIWKFLVVDKVSSVGIYGMGGVGKTTLAKYVNNQLLEKGHECVYWVTVSRDFSIKMLQDKIARKIKLDLSDEHDEDVRAAKLNRELSQRKNLVLILDDVWENIDLLKVGDPLSLEGCRLMLTTRSLRVCRQIGCEKEIAVKTLEMNEAWNLFRETLGPKKTLKPEIQKIAMSVAEQCGGLPLGIITIAGSLKGVTDVHEWNHMLDKLQTSNMGEEDSEYEKVFKALKCSFERLASSKEISCGYTELQLCFLYCCLYPEDYKIERKDLINKFISEEMLDQKSSRKRQLDEGHCILNKLVEVCLLESTLNYMGEDCVKMHDLVRDMALKITKGKYKAIGGPWHLEEFPNGEEYWSNDLEKMSLMNSGIAKIPDGMTPNCPKLSTLLLNDNRGLAVIPSSFFSQLNGLRTLDLSRSDIFELPNSVLELERLKALLLERCWNLKDIPYILKLTELRELNLSGTAIKEVPQGMEKLVNLRGLKINAEKLEMLPGGLLRNFSKLQCLHLPFKIEAPVEEIENLKQLQEFKGRVKDLCDFNKLYKRLQSMGGSERYGIVVGDDFPQPTYEAWRFREVVMRGSVLKKAEGKDVIMLAAQDIQRLIFNRCEGLSNCLWDDFYRFKINPKSLQTLTISDCEGVECILKRKQFLKAKEKSEYPSFQMLEEMSLYSLPNFVGVMMFQIPASPPPTQVFSSLRSLEVTGCNKMRNLGIPASELKNLENLFVSGCKGIEEIIQVAEGEGDPAAVVSLPNLKRITLHDLPRLKSICNCATMVCSSASPSHPPARLAISSLKSLQIQSCGEMMTLGLRASELQNLKYLRVFSCEKMTEIIQVVAGEDGRRGGEQGDQPALVSLPKLRRLELFALRRLRSICRATMACDSIETIEIWGCPSLKRLPLYFPPRSGDDEIGQPPPLLQLIASRPEEAGWWASLEWEHPSHKHLLEPFLGSC